MRRCSGESGLARYGTPRPPVRAIWRGQLRAYPRRFACLHRCLPGKTSLPDRFLQLGCACGLPFSCQVDEKIRLSVVPLCCRQPLSARGAIRFGRESSFHSSGVSTECEPERATAECSLISTRRSWNNDKIAMAVALPCDTGALAYALGSHF